MSWDSNFLSHNRVCHRKDLQTWDCLLHRYRDVRDGREMSWDRDSLSHDRERRDDLPSRNFILHSDRGMHKLGPVRHRCSGHL